MGQFLLIPFVGSETNCHFGHNTRNDCPKSFVEAQWGFPLDYLLASHEEAVAFGLLTGKMRHLTSSQKQCLTPGARARRESCMRTLIVSGLKSGLISISKIISATYPKDDMPELPSFPLHLQLSAIF